MRQRKLKNEDQKLAVYSRYMAEKPSDQKGDWNELFQNTNEIYVEIGCGKGKFIVAQAETYPDHNYIGIEGQRSVILRALEKTDQKQLMNVLFINAFTHDIRTYFDTGELAGIYLNFSDPWPKVRHEKRRLTGSRYLKGYKEVLKEGGCIAFKTDNAGLFSYSLKSFVDFGMRIVEQTQDLHKSTIDAGEITTEYEEKFRQAGRNIYYCKARF